MFSTDTNRAQRVIRLLDVAARHGLDRQKLLDGAGLTKTQIADPDSRVPLDTTLQLWSRLAEAIADPDIGLEVGTTVQVRKAGVVGYSMLHSQNLLGAVTRIVRFAKLFNQTVDLSLKDLGDRWRLQADNDPFWPEFRPAIDEGIASLIQGFGEILGRPVVAASVHFNYAQPADTTAHRQLFGSQLHFGEPRPALCLWRRDMLTATLTPDTTLTRYLDELAEIRLEALPNIDTYGGKVHKLVWPRLSEGVPPIQEIARELALSGRSLQRRLREEDTSYAKVVEDMRRDKAVLLLGDRALAIYEIGFLLGYADPSTFYRAFRRWYGISPSQYRVNELN